MAGRPELARCSTGSADAAVQRSVVGQFECPASTQSGGSQAAVV
jgi:hypothetical protein